jgi:SAM-dependent methyltransferase
LLDAAQENTDRILRLLELSGDERLLAIGVELEGAVAFEGDPMALPYERGSFDRACIVDALHRVRRPELVVAELARVTRPGGRILIADQLGHVDPSVSAELDRFERGRDASHQRLLPDGDVRYLLDANDLVVSANEIVREQRDVERVLDLAGLVGEERERVRHLAPASVYEVEIGWYVAHKRGASL